MLRKRSSRRSCVTREHGAGRATVPADAGPSERALGADSLARLVAIVALSGMPSACTYAPPVAIVRVANHVLRPGTDSIAIAVVASTHRRPTGLAAFPDGGAPRVEREQGMFYLCVPDAVAPAPVLRRIAIVPRPDSLRSGFTAWVSGWEDPERFVASLRGYTANESRPETHRTAWMVVRLDGTLSPLAEGRTMSGPATSLPRSCEAAAIADGTAWLAQHVAPER
jgi:hypothetical protein